MKKAVSKSSSPKPAKIEPRTILISLRIQTGILDRLKELAELKGTGHTTLIKIAVAEYLERQTKK